MKTVYAREQLDKSIFLAGPTPRKHTKVRSWRPEALHLLEKHNFNGTVFVPEDRNGQSQFEYDNQVKWEWEALNQCTIALFWVPRDLEDMPAFTTNVEFGFLVATGKVLLGWPDGAAKMSYLDYLASRFHVRRFNDLESMIMYALEKVENPYSTVQC